MTTPPIHRAPSYSARAAAERIGVPTATLRSWNQRYGVGPAEHRPGQHRLYSESDIAVLLRMRELISQGVSPRSAARAVTGRVPTGNDSAAVLTAAFTLDVVAAARILDDVIRLRGVADAWEDVIVPAFAGIEARQLADGGCIDVEHALCWIVTRALQAQPMGVAGAPTVLACPEREYHSMPLEALRAALGERGRSALMLGPSVPTSAILDAVVHQSRAHDEGQVRVVLWAQCSDTADLDAVRALRAQSAVVLVAGPGWPELSGAVHVTSLRDALNHLD